MCVCVCVCLCVYLYVSACAHAHELRTHNRVEKRWLTARCAQSDLPACSASRSLVHTDSLSLPLSLSLSLSLSHLLLPNTH